MLITRAIKARECLIGQFSHCNRRKSTKWWMHSLQLRTERTRIIIITPMLIQKVTINKIK